MDRPRLSGGEVHDDKDRKQGLAVMSILGRPLHAFTDAGSLFTPELQTVLRGPVSAR